MTAPYAFAVSTDGIYTIYAADAADNTTIETITIDCIDKDAPVIAADIPEGYASSVTIGIAITD